MSEPEVEERSKTNLVLRIDEHTRERLDRAVAKLPDPKGMQAAILRASLKLYLTLSEGDLEAAESHIKRITGRADMRFASVDRKEISYQIRVESPEMPPYTWQESGPGWRMDEYQDFASILHTKTNEEVSITFTRIEVSNA